MAKRGRPRKIRAEVEPVPVNAPDNPEPDEVQIEGIVPGRLDVEDELESLEVDPYHEESAIYGRNPDDAMGGVGLNFGDW